MGRKKIEKEGLSNKIGLHTGDSETINYSDNTFDAVMVAFGVRNFENLEKGLAEIRRVLKPGGKLVVLEFSKPTNVLIKIPYYMYMKFLTPFIGGLFSKDKAAYAYLDASIQKFPEGNAFLEVLKKTGFHSTIQKKRSFGICSIWFHICLVARVNHQAIDIRCCFVVLCC